MLSKYGNTVVVLTIEKVCSYKLKSKWMHFFLVLWKLDYLSTLDKMEQNGNSMCNNYSQINFHYKWRSVMYENQDRNCCFP